MSSLSKAVAYHVKIIHDHHTGTKRPRKRRAPPRFGSSCNPRANAATATTKQRSKKSSSGVDVRSSERCSGVRLRSTGGCTKRDRRFSTVSPGAFVECPVALSGLGASLTGTSPPFHRRPRRRQGRPSRARWTRRSPHAPSLPSLATPETLYSSDGWRTPPERLGFRLDLRHPRVRFEGGVLLALGLARSLGGEPEASARGGPPLHVALLLQIEHHARELVLDLFVPDRVFQLHLLCDLVHVHRSRGPPLGRGHLVSRPQKLLALVLRFVCHDRQPPSRRFPTFAGTLAFRTPLRYGPRSRKIRYTAAITAGAVTRCTTNENSDHSHQCTRGQPFFPTHRVSHPRTASSRNGRRRLSFAPVSRAVPRLLPGDLRTRLLPHHRYRDVLRVQTAALRVPPDGLAAAALDQRPAGARQLALLSLLLVARVASLAHSVLLPAVTVRCRGALLQIVIAGHPRSGGRGLWRRVSVDKEPGVVPGPVGARGSEGLLVGEQDQEVDELALGEVRVQERAEPLSQVVGVPERPLGVGTICLYVRLMVSLTDLAKELLQPLGKIQFGHVALLEVFLRATRHYSRDTGVPQRRTCPASSALIDSLRDVRVLEQQEGSAASQPRALGAERDRPGAQPFGEPGRDAGVHPGPGRRASGPPDGLDLAHERGFFGALSGRRPEPAARSRGRPSSHGRLRVLLLPRHLQEGRPRGRGERQRAHLQPPERARGRYRRPPLPRQHPTLRPGQEARRHERRQPGLAEPLPRRPPAPLHRRRPPEHLRREGPALRPQHPARRGRGAKQAGARDPRHPGPGSHRHRAAARIR